MEKFFKKHRAFFCEGCSDLGLYNEEIDGCIVCRGIDKDQISEMKFSNQPDLSFHDVIGYYIRCIDAKSEIFNEKSSAGGLVSSLVKHLLDNKYVDYALTVSFDSETQAFVYKKFEDSSYLNTQQRSAYYPVKLDSAIEIIEKSEGTCVVTGIPTAIKALEILKLENSEFKEKIEYTVGLVSGGIKIEDYTDYLCKKSGKDDGFNNLTYLSYREKPTEGDYWGNNYFFRATTVQSEYLLKSDKIKMNWPSGLLKSFASDFCDDIFNIGSDITVMDGWLPRYKKSGGISLAIIRDKKLDEALSNNSDLTINEIEIKDVMQSQSGGISHKTEGLKARVNLYRFFKNDVPENLLKNKHKANFLIYIEQLLRLYTSFKSRVLYSKDQSYQHLDKKLNKYLFALRVVNKLKHILYTRKY